MQEGDGRVRGMQRRVKYIGSTLAMELVVAAVVSLVAVVVTIFSPVQFEFTTTYRVTENLLVQSSLDRIQTSWSGPGAITLLPLRESNHADDDQCGPYALELKTSVRALAWGRPLADVERAASGAGLIIPCAGAQVRMRPLSTLRTALLSGITVLTPMVVFLAWRSRRGRPWLLNWADWSPQVNVRGALGWGVGTGGVAIVSAFVIAWSGQLAGLAGSTESMLWPSLTRTEVLGLVPLIVLAAPIVEEYFFRAWMLERFSRVMPAWLALVCTTLAFVTIHVPQTVLPALIFASTGLLLGLLWLRTRSWLACVVAHGTYNTVVVIVLMLSLPPGSCPITIDSAQ